MTDRFQCLLLLMINVWKSVFSLAFEINLIIENITSKIILCSFTKSLKPSSSFNFRGCDSLSLGVQGLTCSSIGAFNSKQKSEARWILFPGPLCMCSWNINNFPIYLYEIKFILKKYGSLVSCINILEEKHYLILYRDNIVKWYLIVCEIESILNL